MKTFQITQGDTRFTVEAEGYDEAAIQAARKLKGDKHLTAVRVTGINGKSGMFNAYRQQSDGLNSVGKNFHVTEL